MISELFSTTVPIFGVNQEDGTPASASMPMGDTSSSGDGSAIVGLGVSVISGAALAYHGYKRNGGSLGWGAWWALMGFMFGIIPVGVALYEGFGKKAK